MIYFTSYANRKLEILRTHDFDISKEQVLRIAETPESVSRSRFSFYIAEGTLDERYKLRVVFKKENSTKKIITFYPIKI